MASSSDLDGEAALVELLRQCTNHSSEYEKESNSLFLRILSIFDQDSEQTNNSKSGIPIRKIVDSCLGILKPCDIPPGCNENQTIIGAVMFLSSSVPELRTSFAQGHNRKFVYGIFPFLPLIDCVNDDSNSGERCYTKNTNAGNGHWKLCDSSFIRKLKNLEMAYMASETKQPDES